MPLASAESEILAGLQGEIDAMLAPALDALDLAPSLRDAMKYGLVGGGKRLRPALVLLSAQIAGGDRSVARAPAIAIECVHAFSLIHDDLPALDNDDLRRGRPTLHRHAGEAMAILAGDALLVAGFEVLAAAPLESSRRTELMRELAWATNQMVSGQVFDTLGFDPGETASDRQRLERIHRLKTGALIRCATRLGAIAAGAPAQTLSALTAWSEAIGQAFQVVDDLLDVTQSTAHLGKRAEKDAAAGKLTYPGVYGIEESRRLVRELSTRAAAALAPLGAAANTLKTLGEQLASRTR